MSVLSGALRSLAGALLLLGAIVVQADPLPKLVTSLAAADADTLPALLTEIAATGSPDAERVLAELARGALFIDRRGDEDAVVVGERQGASYQLRDFFSGADLGVARRRDVRRIAIDNQLRAELQSLQALIRLADQNPDVRREAIAAVLAAPGAASLRALAAHREREPLAELRDEIAVGLAVQALAGADEERLADALRTLRGRGGPQVRGALEALLARAELSGSLRNEARQLIRQAERRTRWLARFEAVFFGLSLGSVLLLSAVGLAITFGVMGVINMAHGELMMLGAYTTWGLQQLLPGSPGLALLLAIPGAFLLSGVVGLVIERGVIRFLYGRPLETLLATFGISLILQQCVRSLFSPLNRSVTAPPWLSGAWEIVPGLALTYNRLAILVFSLLVFAGLLLLMRRTRLGLQVRAVSQNRAMARALGVRSARVDALTFALGSGVAGVAGVALSQLTNVGPNLGQAYIIDSFLVVVFGGVGNLWGTLVAAFTLGIANKLIEPALGAVLAKIILLLALIVFLQRRPEGLFPKAGRQDAH